MLFNDKGRIRPNDKYAEHKRLPKVIPVTSYLDSSRNRDIVGDFRHVRVVHVVQLQKNRKFYTIADVRLKTGVSA